MALNGAPSGRRIPRRPFTADTLPFVDSPSVPNPVEPTRSAASPARGFADRGERGRILEALIEVGADHGYEGTTVAGVAAAAGVSQARFEAHFADKEACFLAAYEAMSDVLVSCATAAFERAEGLPWAERVAAALRAWWRCSPPTPSWRGCRSSR